MKYLNQQECVQYLEARKSSYELIIVDDGSQVILMNKENIKILY